jgi:hypothetical protein
LDFCAPVREPQRDRAMKPGCLVSVCVLMAAAGFTPAQEPELLPALVAGVQPAGASGLEALTRSPRAPAAERYFLIIFGSQTTPKLARFCHTWGTVIRVREADDAPDAATPGQKHLDADTISWLPANLRVRPFALRSEPGVNLDLDTTIRAVLAHNQRVSAWGPYEITADLYQRALRRKARLDNGEMLYKAIDPLVRSSSAGDCIHALTDLDRARSRLYYNEIIRFGDSASHFVVFRLHVEGNIIDGCSRHDWIREALGLSCYPIWYREFNGWRFSFPQR